VNDLRTLLLLLDIPVSYSLVGCVRVSTKPDQPQGYETVAFHHHNGLIPNVTLFRWIVILVVQMLTFGFVAYYVGPSFVFRRRS
jgi:hypothetical protein